MGALYDIIKEAAESGDTAFLEDMLNQQAEAGESPNTQLDDLVSSTEKMPTYLDKDNPAGDAMAMRKYFPTSQEENRQRMLYWLKVIGGTGLGVGALMSLLQGGGSMSQMSSMTPFAAMPRREMPIQLPKVAAAGFTEDPKGWLMDKLHGAKTWAGELFEQTDSPLTNPLFLPAATTLGVAGVYGGTKLVSALLKKLRERRMKREMDKAKAEFQGALQAQYSASKNAGACDINDAIDALSQAYASGELMRQCESLEKAAKEENESPFDERGRHVGAGNTGIGVYLSLMALLGMGGIAGGYAFAKRNDPERERIKALERALRRRQLAAPPQFVVRREGEE